MHLENEQLLLQGHSLRLIVMDHKKILLNLWLTVTLWLSKAKSYFCLSDVFLSYNEACQLHQN